MKQIVAITCAGCGEPKLVKVRTREAAARAMAGTFFCPRCGKKQSEKLREAGRAGMRSLVEANEPNATCLVCGKRFYSEGTLADVLIEASGKPPSDAVLAQRALDGVARTESKREGAGVCSFACMIKRLFAPPADPN